MRRDEGAEPSLPQHVWQACVAVQLMVALDQALTLRSQALRQETEIEVLRLVGESCLTRIVGNRHNFHRSASRRANRFRSMHQHNDSRHISSMDNRGRFHRKKIANACGIFFSGEKRCVPIAPRLTNVAEKTQRGTNYWSA